MAEIKQIGGNFFVEYVGNGLKFQKFAGKKKPLAEKLRREIEESLEAEGTDIFNPREFTLEQFHQKFTEHIRTQFPGPTFERFRATLQDFYGFLEKRNMGGANISAIKPKIIDDYKADLIERFHNRPDVVAWTMILLVEILEYARVCAMLNDNPARHIPLPQPAGAPERKTVDQNATEELIAHIRAHADINGEDASSEIKNQIIGFSKTKKDGFIVFRNAFACELLRKGCPLTRFIRLMGFQDIIRAWPYRKFFRISNFQ